MATTDSDTAASDGPPSGERRPWQLPGWYQRVGRASWYFIGVVIALGAIAAIISATASIVAPLVLGALLAVAFLPIVDWLERRSLPRAWSAVVVLVGLIASVVAIVWVMIEAVWGQSDEISSVLDAAIIELRDVVDDLAADPELVSRVESVVSDAMPTLGSGLASLVVSILDSAFGLITGSLLGAIVMYYVLKDGPALGRAWVERSDEGSSTRRNLGERVISDVRNYLRGRTALAATNGVGIGLGAAAMGVPAAGAIAVVNFVGGYIPYVGAFIAGAFAVLMALGDGGLGPALVMLALTLVLNIGLENLLEPKLLGDSLNLHPLLVLLATALGGLMAGMIGLILAAPVTAIVLDIKGELEATGFFDEPERPDRDP